MFIIAIRRKSPRTLFLICGGEALRMSGPDLCNECATSTLAQKCNELGNQKRISHVETSLKKGVSGNRLVCKKSKK